MFFVCHVMFWNFLEARLIICEAARLLRIQKERERERVTELIAVKGRCSVVIVVMGIKQLFWWI